MHFFTHAPSFSRKLRLFAGLTAALALAPAWAAETAAASKPAAAAAAGPRIGFAATTHDFGTVPQGQTASFEFKVTNSGDELLEISEVKPSCGCTTAGEWPHQLKPGESGTIPLKVDTAHFVGGITKTVTVTSNDREHPNTVLEMKATVWTPVKISSSVLIFPALTDPTQATTRSVTIENQVEGTLTLSEVHCDLPQFKPELKEVAPGKQYELVVTTVPPLQEGTQTARITMRSSNASMPEISIQAVATVLPAIQIAPTELMFSTRKLTAAEKRFAVVLNHRGADLHVTDLTTDAPGVELTTTTSSDRKQFTITLNFPAGFEIHPNDKFTVRGKTDQPSVPSFEIPIVFAGDR